MDEFVNQNTVAASDATKGSGAVVPAKKAAKDLQNQINSDNPETVLPAKPATDLYSRTLSAKSQVAEYVSGLRSEIDGAWGRAKLIVGAAEFVKHPAATVVGNSRTTRSIDREIGSTAIGNDLKYAKGDPFLSLSGKRINPDSYSALSRFGDNYLKSIDRKLEGIESAFGKFKTAYESSSRSEKARSLNIQHKHEYLFSRMNTAIESAQRYYAKALGRNPEPFELK